METTLMAIPPKDGIAMGTMISDPLPVDVNTPVSKLKKLWPWSSCWITYYKPKKPCPIILSGTDFLC
jgi:hypothetical protein